MEKGAVEEPSAQFLNYKKRDGIIGGAGIITSLAFFLVDVAISSIAGPSAYVIFLLCMLSALFFMGYALGGTIKSGFMVLGFWLGLGIIMFGLSKVGITLPSIVYIIVFVGWSMQYFEIQKRLRFSHWKNKKKQP
jgi:hypothetical protein